MRVSALLCGLVAGWGLLWAGVTPAAAQSLASGSFSFHTLGIRPDGTVAAWGTNGSGQVSGAASVTNATAVSAGLDHSLALRSDGTVAAWGFNGFGLVSGAASITNATAVSAGGNHSLALRSDGTVAAWGYNGSGQVSGAASVTNATAVSAGLDHSLALRSDGTVAAWGDDGSGQVSGATSVTNATAVSAGGSHSLALRSDGTIAAWGYDVYGQVSHAASVTNATAVSASGSHSLALRSDGTIAAWGDDGFGRVSGAASVSNAVYTMAGTGHSYAVLRDGSITSWGSNNYGQGNTPSGFALPETVRWTAATSADYLSSHLWEGRIPSTALSTAVFDQTGSYTVGFGNTAMAAGLNIDAGNVSFDLGSHQYQVGGNVNVAAGASLATNGAVVAGGTVSNNGLIEVASGGQLSGESIGGSGTLVNNGAITGEVAMSGGGVLKGSGHVDGLISLCDGAVLSPGNSVGLLTGTDSIWGSGGVFDFEINDALGTFGGPDGWDGLQLSGVLDITATAADPFLINISSLDLFNNPGWAANFDPLQSYNWTLVTAAGGITGFSPEHFLLDWSGFQNDIGGGAFSIVQQGANSLAIRYSAVPEPSSLVVFGMLAGGLIVLQRRRRGVAASLP